MTHVQRREPPRQRRLRADYRKLQELAANSDFIHIEEAIGDPPERYVIRFTCKGITGLQETGKPKYGTSHRVSISLPKDYPLCRPDLRLLTPIFHPNIYENGRVCMGSLENWSPALSLDELCVMLGRMIQYQTYNPGNPAKSEAAQWAVRHSNLLPVDDRPLRCGMPDIDTSQDAEIKITLGS